VPLLFFERFARQVQLVIERRLQVTQELDALVREAQFFLALLLL
jgi:hypothetical protein